MAINLEGLSAIWYWIGSDHAYVCKKGILDVRLGHIYWDSEDFGLLSIFVYCNGSLVT
jgi:hypothetical protein